MLRHDLIDFHSLLNDLECMRLFNLKALIKMAKETKGTHLQVMCQMKYFILQVNPIL